MNDELFLELLQQALSNNNPDLMKVLFNINHKYGSDTLFHTSQGTNSEVGNATRIFYARNTPPIGKIPL